MDACLELLFTVVAAVAEDHTTPRQHQKRTPNDPDQVCFIKPAHTGVPLLTGCRGLKGAPAGDSARGTCRGGMKLLWPRGWRRRGLPLLQAVAAAGGVAARFVPLCAVLARVGPSKDPIRVRVRVRC